MAHRGPLPTKCMCFDCEEREAVTYSRCVLCFVHLRKNNAVEFTRLRGLTRTQKANDLEQQRKAKITPGPWSWEGREDELAEQFGNENETES